MLVNIKYLKKILCHIRVLLLLIFLFKQTVLNAATPCFTLSGTIDNVSLAKYISYYEDVSGDKTLEDIKLLDDSKFKALTEQTVNLGYSGSAFWLKLNILNTLDHEKPWVLESEYPLIDYITVYIPVVFGFNEIKSGDRLPFSTMPYEYYNFISRITSAKGNSTVYIRIKSEGAIYLKFRAWDEKPFIHNMFNSMAIFWLFYGVMLALMLYNLFIFLSTKDKSYLTLSLFILSNLLFYFTHNGMARKYFWPELTWWGNYSHPFFVYTSITFLIWFTKRYLNTRNTLPLTNRILNLFLIFIIPACFISLFIPYSYATRLSVLSASATGAYLIFFTMLPMFRVNKRLASYYLLSWLFFSLGAILLSLRSYGIIYESFIAEWSFQISFATGTILLSVGVADKLNTLRRENQKAIQSLKESEERYRLFFDTANDAILFFADETPVYANKNMLELSGYTENEFYKINISSLFPDNKEFSINLQEEIRRMTSGKINHSKFEYMLLQKDGKKIYVLISISSIASGNHNGIFMIISDITSMKNATEIISKQYYEIQAQLDRLELLNNELVSTRDKLLSANSDLEKEKEYLSATLTSIGDGVISYNTEGKIFLMNKVAENLTGFSTENAIGKDIHNILKTDDESQELLFGTFGTISDKYNFSNIGIPFKIYDQDGNERIIELNSSVIKLHGNPLGIVLAMRDITIKSKIDNEVIKMSKLESIGILAGGIAHDFNNLLTGISGNISIMKNTKNITQELRDSLRDIDKALERATALTKQLLTFAKGGDPVIMPCSIERIINESVKFIIKKTDIKTEITADSDIPDILADPNQMSQVINNLLINSIHAMPGGGSIRIEIKKAFPIPPEIPVKNGKYLLIKITDTGCGISKKNINKIFDPFFTTKPEGTGFGLTSTYSIIKKHKGYIKVDSLENVGTTFEMYIRISETKGAVIEDETRNIEPSSGGSVLIMDDEDYIIEVLVKMLQYHGFTVSTSRTGEEAISLYKKRFEKGAPFDYVILDLTVYNGLGGKETIEILKIIDPSVRAIVSSGYSDNPILSNYRDYGFKGILLKPYVLEDVISALKKT